MKTTTRHFTEICIYDVKPEKCEEFEELIQRVSEHHKKQKGFINSSYIRRTHMAADFKAAYNGEPAIKLSEKFKNEPVTYALYWELEDINAHAKSTRSGLEKFYKDFRRCMAKAPKIYLGERIA